MKKCECYHEVIRETYIPSLDRIFVAKEGECWGTKERDVCSCKGDKCQCDIYPDIRQKSLEEKQSKRGKVDIIRTLQHYLDFNEEDGVVHIPKVTIEKIIEELIHND